MKKLAPGQFTVYATFLAKQGQYKQLKAVNQQSLQLMQKAPGLLSCQVLEPPKENKPFIFTAIWASHQDFKNFMQSPETQAFHNREEIKKLHDSCMQKATAEFYTLMDAWTPESE